MVEDSQETTHFGFQTVAKEQKADMVAHVFHSVAAKYDVMNDLMSFGIHRLWKRFTIDCSGVRRGQTVLDLAGGTGDLTAKFSRLVGETGRVMLADINDSMLKMGRENCATSVLSVTSSMFRPTLKRCRLRITPLTASPSPLACVTLPIKTKRCVQCTAC